MRGKSTARTALILALAFFLGPPIASARSPGTRPLGPGQVRQIVSLRPFIDVAEGIAIDDQGHIFISVGRLENDIRVVEILEIALDGTVSVFATLNPAGVDSFDAGPAGLAFDSKGDLYAAVISSHPKLHGVWRVRRDSAPERLEGSQRMLVPNALAFDSDDNLYVTDSIGGAVWRFPPGGHGRSWIRDPLLAPDPAIGANGIAFVPPNNLYVANLDRALIARIRIRPDGGPTLPEIAAAGYELLGIDGLAADQRGMLHACIVVSVALGTSPLVEVDPETGKITPSTADPSAFDLPTSPAIGRGPLDRRSVFVVNSGFFPEDRPEAAPGVIQVGVGVRGASALNSAVAAGGAGEIAFRFALDPYPALEGNSTISIPVQRFGGSLGAVTVNYRPTGDTAVAGKDFSDAIGTLSWADGETGYKMAEIQILDDSIVEGGEFFSVQLSNPTGGATIPLLGGFQPVLIVDNDRGFSIVRAAGIGEAGGAIILSVSRIGPATGAVSVNYSTSSGSAKAGSDFTSVAGTLNWADGDSDTKEISVSITNDTVDESNEQFTVSLSDPSPGMGFDTQSTTVTITDDDMSTGGAGGGGGGGALDWLAVLFVSGLAFLRRRPVTQST